jgi:hypothetical protein
MGAKLLFIVGIIVAHGALAAGWVHHEVPMQRAIVGSCVHMPGTLPNIAPAREIYAMAVIPIAGHEVSQP